MPRIAYRNRLIYLLLALSWLLLSAPGAAEQVVGQGVFTGASGHTTSGSVRIVKTTVGFSLVLGPDFFLDGAPDPKVGFGKQGVYDRQSQLDHLRANRGQQRYAIPASVPVETYDEVYIWCEKYSVPLGVAAIEPG